MRRVAFAVVALALTVARPAAATLVMASSFLGPHGPGVVVACDRRATLGPRQFIDGATKLHTTKHTLFSVTGFDRPVPDFYVPDEISRIVGDHPVQTIADIADIARALVAEMPPVPTEDDDGGLFRVSFYDPTRITSFMVRNHGQVSVSVDGDFPVAPHLALTTELAGQPDFFGSVVRPMGFLSSPSVDLLDRPPPTREVTFDAAERFVVDIIESSARAAETHPPRWGIGGGVDVFAIDSAGPRHIETR